MPKVAALVPMRAHSERVPGKNTRALLCHPGVLLLPSVFHWVLKVLMGCQAYNWFRQTARRLRGRTARRGAGA